MRLQHPIEIYRREGDCVVDWTHTSFWECALDGANPFSYRTRMKQPLSLPSRAVLVIYWTSVYIVNDSPRSFWKCGGLGDCLWCCFSLPACCANVMFKVPDPDEFLHQVMQTLALFSGVAMILMEKALSTLVPSIRIFLDWLQSSEVR